MTFKHCRRNYSPIALILLKPESPKLHLQLLVFPVINILTDWLKEILKHIDGVIAINLKNDIFHIECSRDLTPDIARAIVESGAGLNYLNKKEYGLDDIYYRYFEGGEDHE